MKRLEIFLKKYTFIPGETVEGMVVLRIDKPLKVRDMTLYLEGLEQTRIEVRKGSGKSSYTVTYSETNPIIYRREFLTPKMEIPAGEHRKDFSFQLPNDALPTYHGTHANVTYIFKAHADVPLWFDVKTQRTFWVLYSPEFIQAMSKPTMAYTDNYESAYSQSKPEMGLFGKKKPKPSFMVELDKNTFMAGETINGRIVVRNPTNKTIRKVKVRLIAEEYAKAGGYQRHVKIEKHKHKIEMDDIILDIPSKFSIPIPRKAKTTYSGVYSRLNWYLEFQLDIAFAFDVKAKVPIAIYQWRDK